MDSFRKYFVGAIIGVFPFVALFYHVFVSLQVYKIEGALLGFIALITPVISDAVWLVYSILTQGVHLYHILGVIGVFFGYLWIKHGRNRKINSTS
ncbi:hypothetical protein MY04_4992 [Flammeovirga sp. MY04]|uniref:hypothetical protein n=1 Tax=Flammeovirga sp. MY04 TaxID=1191459 RepID=UPI0008062148|nr:hypothetical protein [Flammeovirga sp. MY04]ANQ52327.1 hypothetical protein MY04_4992 [Flammeovirga sp. MY04]